VRHNPGICERIRKPKAIDFAGEHSGSEEIMQKILVGLTLLLVGTMASQGQEMAINTSSSSGSTGVVGGQQSTGPGYTGHERPIGSFTESFVYVESPNDLGADRSLIGFSVVPALNPAHGFGLQGDFERLYMRSIALDENRLLMAAGPRFNFAPRARFTPFVYAEGGEMRSSAIGRTYVDWNPVAKGGFGFQSKLSRSFAVTLVPGEYLGRYQDDGTWLHSFSARVGITFLLDHGRSAQY
jgi:hypothetical protein